MDRRDMTKWRNGEEAERLHESMYRKHQIPDDRDDEIYWLNQFCDFKY